MVSLVNIVDSEDEKSEEVPRCPSIEVPIPPATDYSSDEEEPFMDECVLSLILKLFQIIVNMN